MTSTARTAIVIAVSLVLFGCSATTTGPVADLAHGTQQYILQNGQQPPQWETFDIAFVKGPIVQLTTGPDEMVWATESATACQRLSCHQAIDRLDLVTGRVKRFVLPKTIFGVEGIATGPDGDLWFTVAHPPSIGKMTTGGSTTFYQLGSSSTPFSITAGPDGNMWFADQGADAVGKITTSGQVTEYPVPSGSPAKDIVTGADGLLWFDEATFDSRVGSATTGGTITEYTLPTQQVFIGDIAPAVDGGIWFTETSVGRHSPADGHKIGRVSTTGTITEFAIAAVKPWFLTSERDGKRLFIFDKTGLNSFSTVTDTWRTIGPPPNGADWQSILMGIDGNIFFSEPSIDSFGVFVRNVLSVTPTSLTLTVGTSQQVSASEPNAGLPLRAITSNKAVATVASSGPDTFLVTGVGPGTCLVTVEDHRKNAFDVAVSVQ